MYSLFKILWNGLLMAIMAETIANNFICCCVRVSIYI